MTATQALSIVIDLPAPPNITTTTLPAGVAGTAIQPNGCGHGVRNPHVYDKRRCGAIRLDPEPRGSDFRDNLTPLTSHHNFTVMVTDSSNPAQTATRALSILINLPPRRPSQA